MTSHKPECPETSARALTLLRFMADEAPGLPLYRDTLRSAWGVVYLEFPKLELEARGESAPPLVMEHFSRALEHIRRRLDCCDFSMAALLRMLYRYPNSRLLTPELREAIAEACIGHIYWLTEPGEEHMCFCTENHQIIHHTNELLAGQLFPDRVFTSNGQTGRWHREHAEKMIARWLDWRIRFGYSEWNSNCYYDEDLMALPNLVDYAEREDFSRQATGLLDLTFLHIGLNSFRGTFGSTHGRTYTRFTLNPRNEPTSALGWLMWGLGHYREKMSPSALMMTTCSYRLPEAVRRVATDLPAELENRERHSLDAEEALDHGVDPASLDDIGFFWGAQLFDHHLVIDTSMRLCPEKHNMYPRIKAFNDHQKEAERLGLPFERDPDNTAMSKVNVYTFRTPDYMLSCAQDFRKGKHGFQQHIWQATLADRAVVYTTQPGARDIGQSRPDYWHANAFLPRAAAHRNVLVCLYRFDPALSHMWFTHAYFPQFAFDEWTERDGWVFGRKGDGYVALRSLNPMRWAAPRDDVVEIIRPLDAPAGWAPGPHELVALGPKNAWVCELGNPASHGSYARFVDKIASAGLAGDAVELTYDSPSLGRVEFGWEGDLRVDGQIIRLGDYPRFDNPYCQAPFGTKRYTITYGDASHVIDLA